MVAVFRVQQDVSIILDMLAIEYGDGTHVKHRLMDYHRFFTERITPDSNVLDIGCGDGDVAYSIVSRTGARVVGLDISRDKIKNCKERFQHSRLQFHEMDATDCRLSEKFDIIVLSNVLEHIEDRISFLHKIVADFTPTRMLIRVPMINRSWYVPLKKELGLPYYSDATHYTEYTLQSFQDEIAAADLHIDSYQVNWGEIWAVISGGAR